MNPYSCETCSDRTGRIVGKRETVAGNSVEWAYDYDKAGRLTKARLDGKVVCQCWYDREGRRARDHFPLTVGPNMRDYAYTPDNRLTRAGNNSYTHDRSGFRAIWNSGGRFALYIYAPDYRLLKVELPNDRIVLEFDHDAQGRRSCKRRNGVVVESCSWLDFLRLAGFHDGEFGYRFLYDEGERTPHAMQREDGAEFHLHYDQVGSLRVVANVDGRVIQEILYDPFGGIIKDTNTSLRIPIGFAGGLHDRELGFVRFGWRDYDTFTGRWTAPDPIGNAGGDPDWYGYCLDDPVNGVDPSGLFDAEHDNEDRIGSLKNILKGGAVGAASGGLLGAGIGSVVPGAGTLVGGTVGTVTGFGKGLVDGVLAEGIDKSSLSPSQKDVLHMLNSLVP
ncbi:RHS repeat domain-containing protein [Pseudodesulfovibrio tunisiensis]|uniref:RHS repeat domain-containing protein n=1 Tax=Pseudodesulfovibrio tunisiensis TaxID=463192 RepID=UPI001FB3C4B6|nr:RHS repeat-associated core domain-containing protein [Pseudodesulfovibrio tunisiensis]